MRGFVPRDEWDHLRQLLRDGLVRYRRFAGHSGGDPNNVHFEIEVWNTDEDIFRAFVHQCR